VTIYYYFFLRYCVDIVKMNKMEGVVPYQNVAEAREWMF
jgi:hypothetical protein